MSSGLNFSTDSAHKAADKIGIPKGKKRAPHRTDYYSLNGRQLFRVTIPHHECRAGTRKNIVRSFRLSNSDFRRLFECSLSKSEYEEHIRRLVEDGQL